MQELVDYAQMIMRYLEQNGANLNRESQLALSEFLGNILQAIEESQQQQAPTAPTPQPLTPGPYRSSNINSFKYDPKNGRLLVKFQGEYPQQNGPVYSYSGVPPFIFDVFRRGAVAPKTSGKNAWHEWKKGVTPSLGAAMHALVKLGGYPYQRVS